MTTETHTYTTTAKQPFTGKIPKAPIRTVTKTKDGWVETIISYETEVIDPTADMFPAPKKPKPTGWNLTHSGKGWNSFKKSVTPKTAESARTQLEPPKAHNFKVFKN